MGMSCDYTCVAIGRSLKRRVGHTSFCDDAAQHIIEHTPSILENFAKCPIV